MAITLFGIASCDACRKARRWLDEHELEYRYHDIRRDGLPVTALREWVRRAGWETVLNKRSATWRKVPDVDRQLDTATQAIALMREFPTLVKRPILSSGSTLLVGFDPESYAATFPEKAK